MDETTNTPDPVMDPQAPMAEPEVVTEEEGVETAPASEEAAA